MQRGWGRGGDGAGGGGREELYREEEAGAGGAAAAALPLSSSLSLGLCLASSWGGASLCYALQLRLSVKPPTPPPCCHRRGERWGGRGWRGGAGCRERGGQAGTLSDTHTKQKVAPIEANTYAFLHTQHPPHPPHPSTRLFVPFLSLHLI